MSKLINWPVWSHAQTGHYWIKVDKDACVAWGTLTVRYERFELYRDYDAFVGGYFCRTMNTFVQAAVGRWFSLQATMLPAKGDCGSVAHQGSDPLDPAAELVNSRTEGKAFKERQWQPLSAAARTSFAIAL